MHLLFICNEKRYQDMFKQHIDECPSDNHEGSIIFFVTTNLGMWLFSGIYPVTYAGLVACYAAALPFFQNTVAGDLFYAVLLFGGFALAQHFVPRLRAGQAQPV